MSSNLLYTIVTKRFSFIIAENLLPRRILYCINSTSSHKRLQTTFHSKCHRDFIKKKTVQLITERTPYCIECSLTDPFVTSLHMNHRNKPTKHHQNRYTYYTATYSLFSITVPSQHTSSIRSRLRLILDRPIR